MRFLTVFLIAAAPWTAFASADVAFSGGSGSLFSIDYQSPIVFQFNSSHTGDISLVLQNAYSSGTTLQSFYNNSVGAAAFGNDGQTATLWGIGSLGATADDTTAFDLVITYESTDTWQIGDTFTVPAGVISTNIAMTEAAPDNASPFNVILVATNNGLELDAVQVPEPRHYTLGIGFALMIVLGLLRRR